MLLILPLLLVLTLTQGAPLLGQDYDGRIADEYIVIYNEDVSDDAIYEHQAPFSLNVLHYYNISREFRGFSLHINEMLLSKILDHPYVKEVHCNGIVHSYCDANQSPTTSWGLSRLAHKGCMTGPLEYTFNHHSNAGAGAVVYILDTGVMEQHEQFNGRVAPGQTFIPNEPPANVDQNGHGTHCAGTAAGNTYGIARNARIVPVKVLGRTGSGSFAGVIAGIDWCANDWNKPTKIPSVCSMSLGAASDGGMNAAVEAAIRLGLAFVVAAGNSNADACFFYPASAVGAITVASSDLADDEGAAYDYRSSFSNYGQCCEIFAPGSDIPSAYIPNSNSYAVLSGTSMACPHVAGFSAFILAQNPSFTPAQLTAELQRQANSGCISNPGAGSPNLLLHNGCGGNF